MNSTSFSFDRCPSTRDEKVSKSHENPFSSWVSTSDRRFASVASSVYFRLLDALVEEEAAVAEATARSKQLSIRGLP